LGIIWSRIQELYKEFGTTTRLTNLTPGMVYSSNPDESYPQLNAKAAETRHLVPIFVVLAEEYDDHSLESTHRRLCARYIGEFYRICMTNSMFLPAAASERLLLCVRRFLVHYTRLASWAVSQGYFMFNLVPKFHDFVHMAMDAAYLNPRFLWCYKMEDFVGFLAAVGASCQNSTPSYQLSIYIADKIRILMHLRFRYLAFQNMEL
jgi:hypothetical protein